MLENQLTYHSTSATEALPPEEQIPQWCQALRRDDDGGDDNGGDDNGGDDVHDNSGDDDGGGDDG